MCFLKIVDEVYIGSVEDLQKFFMTYEVGMEHLTDINVLKKWISKGTDCMWFVEKMGKNEVHIIQYVWDED